MNKLDNLEKIIEYIEKAYDELKEAEESLEENVVSEEIESRILEVKESIGDTTEKYRSIIEKIVLDKNIDVITADSYNSR